MRTLSLLIAACLCLPVPAGAGAIVRPFQPEARALAVSPHFVQAVPRVGPQEPSKAPEGPRAPKPPQEGPRIGEGGPSAGETLPQAAPEGEGLIEQGAKMLLRGLFEQIRPELEAADLPGQLALLKELSGLLAEIDQFHAPEVLPNGDVLIRRKTPRDGAPPPEAEAEIETGPNGEIDL